MIYASLFILSFTVDHVTGGGWEGEWEVGEGGNGKGVPNGKIFGRFMWLRDLFYGAKNEVLSCSDGYIRVSDIVLAFMIFYKINRL